ncbi:MAG TPA: threonine synthase [Candidatus Tetragenococcus pullicola]|nr:threonine synthase [Candidatus Tetragenococcus pullicola]
MTVLYKSTQETEQLVTASQAILQGMAADGGLFVPAEFPTFDFDFEEWKELDYQEVAFRIMHVFLPDFTDQELQEAIKNAYDEKFETADIAPVVKKGEQYFLELFHGPTLAFKDLALSLLPYLMVTAMKKNNIKREIVILTATSGDTGKAAMEAFADVPNTKIIVFYPKDGVSKIQEKQMLTQKGENTFVVAIEGNFDDAQTKVKELLNDQELAKEMYARNKQFSSANSINIGRLVPQIVYYVYAYSQLVKKGEIQSGEKIDVCVPTGNFGNILAGFYAKKIGLPIDHLICASNQNHVLTDFFQTGNYNKKRPFYVTTSPSMDILVSSNLERLLFQLSDENADQTREWMQQLKTKNSFSLPTKMQEKWTDFEAGFATEEETKGAIFQRFKETGYVIDPHTAVAVHVAHQFVNDRAQLIVSTASPYKFPKTVVEALTAKKSTGNDFVAVDELNKITGLAIPQAVSTLKGATEKEKISFSVSQMKQVVRQVLELDK